MMSWGTHVTIWCDGKHCAERYTSAEMIIDNARRQAKNLGWGYVRGRPARDYCPKCAKKESSL